MSCLFVHIGSAVRGVGVRRNGFAAILFGMALVGTGCGSQETISRYPVPKEASTPIEASEPPAARQTAWFFKLEGPAETVSELEAEFVALVESVRFENGKPAWSLPDGWSQTGGSNMRFATLTIDGTDPPLEVSVIPLPVFGSDINEYVRQNIDRWRGQIGLEPSAGADWLETAKAAGEVRELSAGNLPVTFVNLSGKTNKFDPARMLGAVLLPPSVEPPVSASPSPAPSTASTPRLGPNPGRSSALTFETPKGWAPGKVSSMRAASFAVTDGDKKVDISAIAAGGNELDNVNRWRQQIGLEPVSEEELDSTARVIEVDGTAARMFELVGEAETILAVIVPSGGQSWFFKLKGDPTLAEREKANFESFVTSVKFP